MRTIYSKNNWFGRTRDSLVSWWLGTCLCRRQSCGHVNWFLIAKQRWSCHLERTQEKWTYTIVLNRCELGWAGLSCNWYTSRNKWWAYFHCVALGNECWEWRSSVGDNWTEFKCKWCQKISWILSQDRSQY